MTSFWKSPGVLRNDGIFNIGSLHSQLFPAGPQSPSATGMQQPVMIALAEALSRLENLGYPDDLGGRALMQQAFHIETGPLRAAEAPKGERDADMFLFAGAMGHARNPSAHHDKTPPPKTRHG